MKKIMNKNLLFSLIILILIGLLYVSILKNFKYKKEIEERLNKDFVHFTFYLNSNLKKKDYYNHLSSELSDKEKDKLVNEKFKNENLNEIKYVTVDTILMEVDFSNLDISCDTFLKYYTWEADIFKGVKITNNKCTEELNKKIEQIEQKKIDEISEFKNSSIINKFLFTLEYKIQTFFENL